MKTIFARLGKATSGDASVEEINKAEGAYRQVGIELRDQETGQFRDIPKVLDELAGKWNTLTNVQKNYITEVSSGNRQGNIFKNMMDSWTTSTMLNTKALEANGFAQERQEIYLESTKAKIQQFKTTMDVAWQNMLSTKGMNVFLTVITSITQALMHFPMLIGLITTAFLIFKGTALKASIEGMIGAQMELGALTTGGALLNGVMASLTATWTAFSEVLLANPYALWAVGIMSAITLLVMWNQHTENAKKKEEELATERAKNLGTVQAETKKTLNVVSEANKLLSEQEKILADSKAGKATNDEKQRLLEIERQLAVAVPDATNAYDKNNTALATNVDLTRQLVKEKKEQAEIDAQVAVNAIDPNAEVARMQEKEKLMKRMSDYMSDQNKTPKDVVQFTKDTFSSMSDSDRRALEKTRGDEKAYNAELSRILKETSTKYNEIRNSLISYNDVAKYYNTLGRETKTIIADSVLGITAEDEAQKKLNSTVESQIQTEEEHKTIIADLEKSYDKSIDQMGFYAKALKEMDTNGHLSSATIKEIAKNHRDLAPYLNDTKVLYQKIKAEMASQATTAKDTYEKLVMYDKDFISLTEKLKSEGYKTDFKNAKNLADAKIKLEAETIKIIAGAWADYFDAQGKVKWDAVAQDNGMLDGGDTTPTESHAQLNQMKKLEGMQDAIAKKNKENADRLKVFTPAIDFSKLGGDLEDYTKVGKDGGSSGSKSSSTSDGFKKDNAVDAMIKRHTDDFEKQSKVVEALTKNIEIYEKIGTKDSIAKATAENTNKFRELNKELTIANAQKNDLSTSLTNTDSALTKLLGKNVKGMTEEQIATLMVAKYPAKTFTGDKASENQSAYNKQIDGVKELVKNHGTLSKALITNAELHTTISTAINQNKIKTVEYRNKTWELIWGERDLEKKAIQDKMQLNEDADISEVERIKNKIALTKELDEKDKIKSEGYTSAIAQMTLENSKIDKNSELWGYNNGKITEYNDLLAQSNLNISADEKSLRDLVKTQKELNDGATEGLTGLRDRIVSALTKTYEDEKKLKNDALQSEYEKNEVTYTEQIKTKKAELDALKDETKEKSNNLEAKKKELAKWRLVDTNDAYARTKILELEKDIAKDEKDLLVSGKEAEIKSLEDSATARKDKLEADQKANEKDYDDKIKASGDLANALVADVQKNQNDILDILTKSEDKYKLAGETLGKAFKEGIKKEIDDVIKLVNDVAKTVDKPLDSTPPPQPKTDDEASKYDLVSYYADPEYIALKAEWEKATAENDYMKYNDINQRADALKNKYKRYAQGGIVDYTGMSYVDGTPSKPEAFLNPVQTENIGKLGDALNGKGDLGDIFKGVIDKLAMANIGQLITSIMPKLNVPNSGRYGNSNETNAQVNFRNDIHIVNNTDFEVEDHMNSLERMIHGQMKRSGQRIGL